MTTQIEWFNTSEALPKDDKPVIGFDGNKEAEWCYSKDESEGKRWYPPMIRYRKDPIRWAYIPDWPDSMMPVEPGWYQIYKDGVEQPDMMWIPGHGYGLSRYFGSQLCMEKRPWLDYASHTFKKVEALLI